MKKPMLTCQVRISRPVHRRLAKAAKSWHKPVSRYLDEQIRQQFELLGKPIRKVGGREF